MRRADRMVDRAAASRETPRHDRELLAALVETSNDGIIGCSLGGRIATWNAGADEIFGAVIPPRVGSPFLSVITPEGRDPVADRMRVAAEGMPSGVFRSVGLRADSSRVDLSIGISPVRGSRGQLIGVGVIARDVSDRAREEEELRRSRADLMEREAALRGALTALRRSHEDLKATQLQLIQLAKLESIGRLAAGVAHEVKNPLAILMTGSEYLAGRLAGTSEEEVLLEMKSAILRADSVVRGLLDYSAVTRLDPVTIDLHALIEKSATLVRHDLARKRIRLVRELGEDLPPLTLDAGKIEQVIINLLVNAADATPIGGTITVRTRKAQLAAGQAGVGIRQSDPLRIGQTVVLAEVEDSGPGVPGDILPRIFEPFFTTKPAGKGTGLGLAISRTIMGLHGGTLWASNSARGGAVMTMVMRIAATREGRIG